MARVRMDDYPALEYALAGDRVEFYFQGELIVEGIARYDHYTACVDAMRLAWGGISGEWDAGRTNAVRAWEQRRERPEV